MALGECSECGYSPVASGAVGCPQCGARNPNPSVTDRVTGSAMLLGILSGVPVGGVWGFFSPTEHVSEVATAAAGAMAGGIGGLILGLITGLMVSSVAWLFGKR